MVTLIFCFRSELESSGSLSSALNPRGTFRPLSERVVDLAEMHVESRDDFSSCSHYEFGR